MLCVFFFDMFVLFEFLLLSCANKDMMMMMMMISRPNYCTIGISNILFAIASINCVGWSIKNKY